MPQSTTPSPRRPDHRHRLTWSVAVLGCSALVLGAGAALASASTSPTSGTAGARAADSVVSAQAKTKKSRSKTKKTKTKKTKTTSTRPSTTSTTTTTSGSTTSTTSKPPTTSTTSTSPTSTWETVIDSSSLTDWTAFEKTWNYLYPWGSDHNGSARMYGSSTDHNHVRLDGGVLSLLATRITWDEGNSTANPKPKIYYHSGAVHAKSQVVVSDQFPNWEVKGTFQAPSAKGTWPAFWLTGATSWPPEIDVLEFKGDNRNWFNTFRTSSDVSNTIVSVNNPGDWHTYRIWMTKANATDVTVHFYVDGVWKGQHNAAGFVGKPMWLIMNLQMEGSSGSPGPGTGVETWYRAKDIYVGRTRAF